MYAKIMEYIDNILEPKPPKEKQSIFNMMENGKGNTLDMLKQTGEVGLRAKCCKGIESSESTNVLKFTMTKDQYETDEQAALVQVMLQLKLNMIKEAVRNA
jgi:hypothetical protein